MKASIIIHDTWIVLRADDEALKLFRAKSDQLVGVPLTDLIDDADLRGLASLRMQIARQKTPHEIPEVDYLFKRFDATKFYGRVRTTKLSDPSEWESEITFLYEAY